MLSLLDEFQGTKTLPIGVKTGAASAAAAGFRLLLMPVDALKTTLQVQGASGISVLANKIKSGGVRVLWHGAAATYTSTLVSHLPWFTTFNYLQEAIPKPADDEALKKFARNGGIGFCASFVSDTISNSIRVVKTTKQTSKTVTSYPEAIRGVIASDGIVGLFTRGLGTRLVANGMQGMMFSVLWKFFQEQYEKKTKAA
jgi:Mitochondrial carrier protein